MRWRRFHLVAVARQALPAMPRGYGVQPLEQCPADPADQARLGCTPAVWAFRQDQGAQCLVARRASALCGAIWVTAAPFLDDEIEVVVRPGAGMAWDLGLHVPPAERSRRTLAALLAGLGDWLDSRQLQWSASRIADYNTASLAAHARLGALPMGTVSALQLGPWQWTRAALQNVAGCHRLGHQPPVIALHGERN